MGKFQSISVQLPIMMFVSRNVSSPAVLEQPREPPEPTNDEPELDALHETSKRKEWKRSFHEVAEKNKEGRL